MDLNLLLAPCLALLLLVTAAAADTSIRLNNGLAFPTNTSIRLNNGLAFPAVSFGLQVYDNPTASKLTTVALKAGIRNFFASVLAQNQKGFGQAIAATDVPRQDIFICGSANTASCSGFDDCYAQTKAACVQNLQSMKLAYLDMIMLDYPGSDCPSIQGQWKAFEEMYHNHTTKSIAVSNFSPQQLKCLPSNSTTPALNQLPYSIGHGSDTSVADNKALGDIVVQAYSPLGSGSILLDPDCVRIGKEHNKSSAQVALRWIIQRNATFTTSASSSEHFQQDLDIFDFELTAEDMKTLNAKK
jgi:diketogulonate reductase-like aldo/keto reductase